MEAWQLWTMIRAKNSSLKGRWTPARLLRSWCVEFRQVGVTHVSADPSQNFHARVGDETPTRRICWNISPVSGRRTDKPIPRFLPARPIASFSGEMSGLYLSSERAVLNILKDSPDARFIVMLRNPIDMARSIHSLMVNRRYEDQSSFQSAWELQDARAAGERIPPLAQERLHREPNLLLYRQRCSFASQMERLFQRVQRERLLVHVFEEFFADVKASYQRTLAFLNLPDDERAHFERINEHAMPRSWLLNRLLYRPPFPLSRLYRPLKRTLNAFGLRPFAAVVRANTRKEKPAALDASFRRRLEAEFRPEIVRLEAILGRSRYLEVRLSSPLKAKGLQGADPARNTISLRLLTSLGREKRNGAVFVGIATGHESGCARSSHFHT